MRNRHFALIAVATVALAGCGLLEPSAEVRYRVTIDINTPNGVRSGTGVWSFALRPGNIDQAYNARFRGEAIPVDLPSGSTKFATLEVAAKLPEDVVARRYFPNGRYPAEVGPERTRQIEYIRKNIRSKIALECKPRPKLSECPILVAFKSPANPISVYEVNPEDLSSLGHGYSLRSVSLQVTDEKPTHQLGDRLPWLDSMRGKTLDGRTSSDYSSLANILTFYSFKRWDK